MKTCKFAFYPDQIARQKLWSLSYDQTLVWNKLIDQTNDTGFDYKKLHETSKNFRKEMCLTSPAKMTQNTCIRLISMWKSFLTLRKTDESARAPKRYASTWNFSPLIFDWNSGNGGFYFTETHLVIRKPEMQIKLPRYALDMLEATDFTVADLKISMKDGKFFCSMTLKDINQSVPAGTDWASIDPGLTHVISMITSSGKAVKWQNSPFKHLERSISEIQSLRDKKKRGSIRHAKLAKKYQKMSAKKANKQRDFQHKLTSEVIEFCKIESIGKIFYGDIKTKKLTKAKSASSGLNKSTQNRGTLGRTKSFLQYKAGLNGIDFVLTNEAYTSKTNCYTGELYPDMNLGTRSVQIDGDVYLDRDINAAINIARRNLGSWLPQLQWISEISTTERYVVV
jgi:putative transposase